VTDARILGTGYRSYSGPRLGPRHAVWTLSRHSFERIMGLRRPARYKVLPILTFVIAYLPAVAFIGAIALLPSRRLGQFVPDPGQYYAFVTAALTLFAADAHDISRREGGSRRQRHLPRDPGPAAAAARG